MYVLGSEIDALLYTSAPPTMCSEATASSEVVYKMDIPCSAKYLGDNFCGLDSVNILWQILQFMKYVCM